MGKPDSKRRLLRLRDLQIDQLQRRQQFHDETETDELAAIKALARRLFGDLAFIEYDHNEPRPRRLHICRWHPADRLLVPSNRRRRQVVLSGFTYTELLEQARALGLSGLPS